MSALLKKKKTLSWKPSIVHFRLSEGRNAQEHACLLRYIYRTGSLDQYQNENRSRHVHMDKESECVNECLSTSAAMLHIIEF